MSVLAAIVIASQVQSPEPLLWLQPSGRISVAGKIMEPVFSPGTRPIKTAQGVTYDFDGKRCGILLRDEKALAVTDSFSIATWLYLRSYVNDGPGAQVLFRGDDRGGLDPYTLVVHRDGTINFTVQDATDRGFHIAAEMPLHRWTHVMGSWDRSTGILKMYIDGKQVAYATTTVQPFTALDKAWTPGVGIGNVQNGQGIHNQPINGQIFDLRLLRGVWEPDDILIRRADIPPAAQ